MSKKNKVEAPLAVGDVVTLKSGGPKMTIGALFPTNVATILWADVQGRVQKADIGIQTLKHA
jgi:uncharacterized protein YodC (DUF2158 family)